MPISLSSLHLSPSFSISLHLSLTVSLSLACLPNVTVAGDIFDPEVAARLRKFIYSTGNSIEPGEAFRSFRGRDPVVEPMLKKKSLL
jgi:hypothetical protein